MKNAKKESFPSCQRRAFLRYIEGSFNFAFHIFNFSFSRQSIVRNSPHTKKWNKGFKTRPNK
jgi:hypothetical protein